VYSLLAVLCARPLIGETFEPLQLSFLEALQSVGGPTPAATAGMDALQLGLAGVLLARSGRRPQPAVLVGIGLLALAVAISSFAAADWVSALRAGMNLVSMAVAGFALCLTLTDGAWRRIALAGLLACGFVTTVKCLNQRFVENPSMRAAWEQNYKPQLLRQGFDPGDPLFVNFERRMLAGEVYGFQGHPNVTGGMLAIWALGIAGLTLGLFRPSGPRLQPVVAVLVLAATLGAMWFTGSLGAVLAVLAGSLLMVLLAWNLRFGWFRRPGSLLLALVLGYAALVGCGLGWGASRGTLPHASLAFRWQYWKTAARIYEDAPLTGIGRENFARPYLRYKPAASTEEVKNPHNLWVGLGVELGPLGLLGAGLLITAALYASLPRAKVTPDPAEAKRPAHTLARIAPLAVGMLLVHATFCGEDFTQLGVVLVWGQEIALVWLVGLAVAAWLLDTLQEASSAWFTAGLCAGLCAALVHGLIDFVLLTPAGLAVFVLTAAGAAHAAPDAVHAAASRARMLTGYAAAAIAVAVQSLMVLRPAWAAESAIRGLRAAGDAPPASAARMLETELARIRSRTSDAGSARFAARFVLQFAQAGDWEPSSQLRWLQVAAEMATLAEQREPGTVNTAVTQARIAEQRARLPITDPAGLQTAQRDAAASWETAVARYPTDPRLRISAATAYITLANHGDESARLPARQHLEAALDIDAQRMEGDASRLRPAERQFITDALAELSTPTLNEQADQFAGAQ
jgi:O-antigen ligase